MFTPKTKNPVNYYLQGFQFAFCDPAGTRTQGPNIKSVVLYQLSYEIDRFPVWECKYRVISLLLQTFS